LSVGIFVETVFAFSRVGEGKHGAHRVLSGIKRGLFTRLERRSESGVVSGATHRSAA
jgi:hypothetical protein